MKLFLYYAVHSFVNQLKKLFKTWVLVFFLACCLIGGVIGFGAASLEDAAQERQPEEQVQQEELPPEVTDLPIEPMALSELVAGGLILAVLAFHVVSADKNGSKIFLPADVTLLFPSPMKPQSVLMFRLCAQLGMVALSSVYLCFQIPNLTMNLGVSLWAAMGAILTWILAFGLGKLLQVLCYTASSVYPGVKRWLRRGIYVLAAVLGLGYLLYVKLLGLPWLEGADRLFNHPATWYIPFWGWMKAMCMGFFRGDALAACLGGLASVLGGAGLAWLIWQLKADFYEDALAKSQETAQLLEAAQSEKAGFAKRKKDRSEKLQRDGLDRGWGASVFFFRVIYNRFRFSHFKIFTKTSETYLFAAAAVCGLCTLVLDADPLIPGVLTLGALVFFRTMGNPLAEDTSKDFFRMIPESGVRKLFWSVAGGTAVALLDLLPGLAVLAVVTGEPLLVAAWIPVLLSVDYYGSTVGAFINLSVPVSAGLTIKQVVMIMFIYFGLLPDIALIAVGLVLDWMVPSVLLSAVVNIFLGSLFLGLASIFLEPGSRTVPADAVHGEENRREARKTFSLLGLGCFALLFSASVLQILIPVLLPEQLGASWGLWIWTFGPIYLVGVPLGLLVMRKAPASPMPRGKMKASATVAVLFVSLFMMYGGNLLGTLVTGLLSMLTGNTQQAAILTYATSEDLWWKLLFMVVLAPVIEEFIFRKILIDRMHPYGQRLAVVVSALMFGLFHGNLTQFFYAFGLGLVFGYVYVRTGSLKGSIAAHMGINFLGSILAPALLEWAGLDALSAQDTGAAMEALMSPGFLVYMGYALALMASALTGLVLLCVSWRKLRFAPAEKPLGRNLGPALCNPGMLLFTGICLVLVLMSL